MIIHKAFKYRIYPTKEQSARLCEWLDLNRELYNAALEERREAWRRAGKSLSLYDQQKELPAVREARPEYQAIPIVMLRGTLQRLDRAFQAFFRRVKAGQKAGYPRFAGKRRFDSLTYNQIEKWYLPRLIRGEHVFLPMFGLVRIVLHRPIQGTVKTITVRRDGDQWYVTFSCEVPADTLPATDTAVGIDLGLEKFAVLSTGEQIANPRYLRHALGALKRKQQALARCQQGSHRRDRARRALGRMHRRVRNQRADFLHKLSRRLVNEYGTIVMEDLKPDKIRRRAKPKLDETQAEIQDQPVYAHNGQAAKAGVNLSTSDAGWGLFRQYVAYKAEEAGRLLMLVDPAFTSQICSRCGAIRKKDLTERWHSCECGAELDRDHNAALNILRRGLRQ